MRLHICRKFINLVFDTYLPQSGFFVSFSILDRQKLREAQCFKALFSVLFTHNICLRQADSIYRVTRINTGSGAFCRPFTASIAVGCEEFRWTSILDIQNYYNPFPLVIMFPIYHPHHQQFTHSTVINLSPSQLFISQCLSHTWYVALMIINDIHALYIQREREREWKTELRS